MRVQAEISTTGASGTIIASNRRDVGLLIFTRNRWITNIIRTFPPVAVVEMIDSVAAAA